MGTLAYHKLGAAPRIVPHKVSCRHSPSPHRPWPTPCSCALAPVWGRVVSCSCGATSPPACANSSSACCGRSRFSMDAAVALASLPLATSLAKVWMTAWAAGPCTQRQQHRLQLLGMLRRGCHATLPRLAALELERHSRCIWAVPCTEAKRCGCTKFYVSIHKPHCKGRLTDSLPSPWRAANGANAGCCSCIGVGEGGRSRGPEW